MTGAATLLAMPGSLHFGRSASYCIAQLSPLGKAKRKRAKLVKNSSSRSSMSSVSTTEEDHDTVCIVTVTSSNSKVAQTKDTPCRKRPKTKKTAKKVPKKGSTPQIVRLQPRNKTPPRITLVDNSRSPQKGRLVNNSRSPHSITLVNNSRSPPNITLVDKSRSPHSITSVDKSRSPQSITSPQTTRPQMQTVKNSQKSTKYKKQQKHRSRSRSNTRKHKVIGLPRGLFHCVGAGARSRSCTPERNIGLRVGLSEEEKENVNVMLSAFSRKAQNTCESDFGGEVEINQIYRPASTSRLSRKDRHRLTCSVASEPTRGTRDTCSVASEPPDLCSLSLTHSSRHSIQSHGDNSNVTYNTVMVKLRRKSAGTTAKSKAIASIQARPLPAIPPPKESSVCLVKTLDLSGIMKNKWISGMAVTKKNEIVLVDLKGMYLIDEDGNLKKTIGSKEKVRLVEPIDVTVMGNGNLVVSDHADQKVKVYNWKGQYLRKIHNHNLLNIAGIATTDKREIIIAGTDKQCVSILTEDDKVITTIPKGDPAIKSPFQHPYSMAVNPLTGAVIVGDDYRQLVVAVNQEGKILWRFCPTGDRHFFPSSICVDNEGYVFVADLYNEKVYMLDSGGKFLKELLSRGNGLRGGPGAIATDGRGHLMVSDEERTIKVFRYGEGGFALYRRISMCPQVS